MTNLTLSGNEITDDVRLAALRWATTQQGGSTDGAAVSGGIGIWEAGTNLHPHGQCDAFSGSNFIGTQAGSVLSIDATTPAPFSPNSLKAVCDGGTVSQGARCSSNTGLAAAAGTVGVTSVYFKGVAGQSYTPYSRWNNTDATSTLFFGSNFIATGNWQLITAPAATVAVGKTGDTLSIAVQINGQRAETLWYAHPMLQILPSSVGPVSPYIATSGGSTATRNTANIAAPISLLNATQGWFAARLTMPYAPANTPSANAAVFGISDGTSNNRMFGRIGGGNGKCDMVSVVAGVQTGSGATVTPGWTNPGDAWTVVCAWTANSVSISVNGGAFITAARSSIPTGLTAFYLGGGGYANGNPLDGTILWAACGTGTLTDADAATLAAIPTGIPPHAYIPAAAQLTGTFPSWGTVYVSPPISVDP